MANIHRRIPIIACGHVWAVGLAISLLASAVGAEIHASDAFVVIDRCGTALLGPDGEEIERLESLAYAAGALSPDGRWVAFAQSKPTGQEGKWEHNMIVQSRADSQLRRTVPQIWGETGSSFLPLWSSDSKRVLICEQGWRDKVRESAYRIYDMTSSEVTALSLPAEWWPSDWSADGKRLLTSLDGRVAWVNLDGTGEPEFITRELEVAYGARASPDGHRILCMAGFRRPGEGRRKLRLSVVDLETKKRKLVDEPGETHGFCWSPDGSRIAYTWQRSLEKPEESRVRETFLIIGDPDGANRKMITSRKYEEPPNRSRSGTIIFFQVLAWR